MTQRGKKSEDFADLEAQLKGIPVPDPGEAFFAAQQGAVMARIRREVEEVPEAPWGDLMLELREIPVAPAGEWFFHRQRKAVREAIRDQAGRRAREGFWDLWWKPLAAAAALFFLVLGIARITHRQENLHPSEWVVALEYLSAQEEPSLDEIDEMNLEQLDRLANNLEGDILAEAGEQLMEEPIGVEDLNDAELQMLIERLEAKRRT